LLYGFGYGFAEVKGGAYLMPFASGPGHSLEGRIAEAVAQASELDWDGDGGLPIASATAARARDFLTALPEWCPDPEVSPEPEGTIAFDWRPTADSALSVSISASEKIGYSWVSGGESSYGVVESTEAFSQVLSALFQVAFSGSDSA
jgi:hypothetical protein